MISLRTVALVTLMGAWAGAAGAQEAADGARLYANHCAACHGEFAEGDGPVAAVMRVTMPNLRTLAMRSGGTFPADDVRTYVDGRSIPAAHGARYMPIWGEVFGWGPEDDGNADDTRAAEHIDALVEHLRAVQYE